MEGWSCGRPGSQGQRPEQHGGLWVLGEACRVIAHAWWPFSAPEGSRPSNVRCAMDEPGYPLEHLLPGSWMIWWCSWMIWWCSWLKMGARTFAAPAVVFAERVGI